MSQTVSMPSATTIPSEAPTRASDPPAAKSSKAKIVFPLLLAIATAVGVGSYVQGLGKESTDDAQVEGQGECGAPISGQVKQVLVKDNQHVNAGRHLGAAR
ncbi:MAG: biotin/lipoyl-binding protein [Polyangiaceae bacterium]